MQHAPENSVVTFGSIVLWIKKLMQAQDVAGTQGWRGHGAGGGRRGGWDPDRTGLRGPSSADSECHEEPLGAFLLPANLPFMKQRVEETHGKEYKGKEKERKTGMESPCEPPDVGLEETFQLPTCGLKPSLTRISKLR